MAKPPASFLDLRLATTAADRKRRDNLYKAYSFEGLAMDTYKSLVLADLAPFAVINMKTDTLSLRPPFTPCDTQEQLPSFVGKSCHDFAVSEAAEAYRVPYLGVSNSA